MRKSHQPWQAGRLLPRPELHLNSGNLAIHFNSEIEHIRYTQPRVQCTKRNGHDCDGVTTADSQAVTSNIG